MSEETSPFSELKPIDDTQEILRYMMESSKVLASIILWTRGQTDVIHTHMALLSQIDHVFYAHIPKDFDLNPFNEEMAKLNGECIMNISLPTAQIFFKTVFVEITSTGLKFRIPNPVYKIQRRKNARFRIPDAYVLRIEYQDPLFPEVTLSKKTIDISAGGLAFATPEVDKAIYPEGIELKNLKFTLHRKLIQVDAEIRHVNVLHDPKHNIKVGVAFKSLPPGDQDLIASYVLGESTKYFGKFLY